MFEGSPDHWHHQQVVVLPWLCLTLAYYRGEPYSLTSLGNVLRVMLPVFNSRMFPLLLAVVVVESPISPSHHKHHPSASIIAALVTIVETSLWLVPALLQSLMQSMALTVESQPGLVTAGTSQWIPVTSLVCRPGIGDKMFSHAINLGIPT